MRRARRPAASMRLASAEHLGQARHHGENEMIRAAAAFLLVLSIAACATEPAPPQSAERETLITSRAVVESVNTQSRQVLLRGQDGRMLSIVAGPEVRNLDQLAAGDVVRIDYFESVSVRMADPSDTSPPEGAVVAERAPEGGRPGAAAGASVRMIVEFISYNPQTAVATFRGPDGSVRTAQVNPELQDFAAGLQSGDRVDLTMTEAVAVSIEEMS
jgi:hypothetical protein